MSGRVFSLGCNLNVRDDRLADHRLEIEHEAASRNSHDERSRHGCESRAGRAVNVEALQHRSTVGMDREHAAPCVRALVRLDEAQVDAVAAVRERYLIAKLATPE